MGLVHCIQRTGSDWTETDGVRSVRVASGDCKRLDYVMCKLHTKVTSIRHSGVIIRLVTILKY